MPRHADRIIPITLCLFWVAGCASRRPVEPQAPGVVVRPTPVRPIQVIAPAVPATLPKAAPAAPRDTEARTPPRQSPPQDTSPAARVAALCDPKFAVSKISAGVLEVEKPGAKSRTSLFQQSITLGKLRSTLKVQGILPVEDAGQSTVRDGTATIEFPPLTSPKNAVAVISAALGVEGVDRIRALLH